MKKLIAKLIKKIFRFLWPIKRKWLGYREHRTAMSVLIDERYKQQMRDALKNTVFHPPFRDTLSGSDEDMRELEALAREKFDVPDATLEADFRETVARLNAPDPSLPVVCTACGRSTSPSKIDDRLVACVPCKLVFMMDEARNDPNVMRDLTHANAGITPRMTTIRQERENLEDEKLCDSI